MTILFQKSPNPLFLCCPAIFNKACIVSFVVALFKIFNQFAGEICAEKAIRISLFLHTALDSTLATVLRLVKTVFQTALTRLAIFSDSNVFIANSTIHSARGKHDVINCIWHLQIDSHMLLVSLLSKLIVIISLTTFQNN